MSSAPGDLNVLGQQPDEAQPSHEAQASAPAQDQVSHSHTAAVEGSCVFLCVCMQDKRQLHGSSIFIGAEADTIAILSAL